MYGWPVPSKWLQALTQDSILEISAQDSAAFVTLKRWSLFRFGKIWFQLVLEETSMKLRKHFWSMIYPSGMNEWVSSASLKWRDHGHWPFNSWNDTLFFFQFSFFCTSFPSRHLCPTLSSRGDDGQTSRTLTTARILHFNIVISSPVNSNQPDLPGHGSMVIFKPCRRNARQLLYTNIWAFGTFLTPIETITFKVFYFSWSKAIWKSRTPPSPKGGALTRAFTELGSSYSYRTSQCHLLKFQSPTKAGSKHRPWVHNLFRALGLKLEGYKCFLCALSLSPGPQESNRFYWSHVLPPLE